MSNVGLNVGIKALLAAQTGLETVGHNVANANTAGYSRQELLVSASPSIFVRGLAIGSGVDADTIRRTTDRLLQTRIASQTGSLARLDSRIHGLSQIEELFGASDQNGLGSALQSLFASFSSLSVTPGDVALRQGVLSSAQGLVARFHDLSGRISEVADDAQSQMAIQVGQVNALAGSIARLNLDIGALEGAGTSANDLRDQRDEVVKQLSAILDVRTTESGNGAVTVLVGGQLLVGPTRAYALSAQKSAAGATELRIAGHTAALSPRKGSLAGLVEISRDLAPGYGEKLDELAKNLVFELNRAHSTGVPAGGPFHALVSSGAVKDMDGDGRVTDEAIGAAGLDFPVSSGELFVNVTDEATGAATTTRIAIDAERTTVGEIVARLDGIAHLSASVDAEGHLSLSSEHGFGFDFSRRIDGAPDTAGTLGGKAATLVGSLEGPFALADGDTLDLTTSSGSFTITLHANQFADISHATAAEVAGVISADPIAAANGLRAVTAGDHVALQTLTEGVTASLGASGGTALAKLGIAASQTSTGQAHAVSTRITGSYTGESNETYTLRPNMDGTIGVTPGLAMDVYDSNGTRVSSLDVGAGYVPGTELSFAHGLSAAFALGDVSRSSGQRLEFHATADSDTSDVLAALGINALMTGTTAADIALSADVNADPALLATSATGASGDNGALRELANVGARSLEALGGGTLAGFYTNLVAGVGSDSSSSQGMRDTEKLVLDGLTARREQVSGVNVDEELVNMTRFQQSYQAAAQYIQVVNQINDELMQIL